MLISRETSLITVLGKYIASVIVLITLLAVCFAVHAS